MSSLARVFLSIAVIAALALWVMLPVRFDVVAPRLGSPAIAESGEAIDVEIVTSVPLWQPDWRIWLQSSQYKGEAAHRIKLAVNQRQSSIQKQILRVNAPSELPAGSYSLIVSDGTTEQLRAKAVHIIHEVPQQISIVQFADLPELGEKAKGDQRLQDIIDEINIVNPELVLMTGDIAYGGSWQQYRLLVQAMERINAPVIAAPGNHEYQGWAAFLTLVGSPHHSVKYGPYQIISLNSGHGRDQLTEAQYAWFQQAIADSDGQILLVQIHHPLFHRPDLRGFVGNHVSDMALAFKQLNVPIVLSGHWHGDAVYDDQGKERRDSWQFDGTPYVVTTAAGADLREKYATSPLHHGYRLIRLQKDVLLNYTYDMDGDGIRDATSSIPLGRLKAERQDATTIMVKNELNESFERALIRFIVPGHGNDLMPNTGSIVNQSVTYDATIYDVQFRLEQNSQQQISLINRANAL